MRTYKLLEKDSVLLSQPLLIEHFGRAGAQFLSQLHYWLEKKDSLGCTYDGSHWIYNSAESWAKQLHLSVRQIRRIISKFVESGILQVEKLNPLKSVRTNYYSIDYEKLNTMISCQTNLSSHFHHGDKMSSSSCHDGTIFMKTKITNKDFNKSEANETKGQGADLQEHKLQNQNLEKQDQVKHVNNLNFKKFEKDLDRLAVPVMTEKKSLTKTKEEKTTTTQDMLAIWHEVLGNKAQTSMSRDLAPLLVSAFGKKFEKNLENWKRYCTLIKSSSYLMGEQFQLSIFWSLKFTIIDRIRAGEFAVKREFLDMQGQGNITSTVAVDENHIKTMIEMLPETDLAKQTRLKICKAVGYAAYHSWFHQAAFKDNNGKIRLEAPNTFVESIWERDYPWVSSYP